MLASCQYTFSNSSDFSSTPPSPMLISTLQSYKTPISVFEYPDQVTDGKLILSIELVTNDCFQANKPIPITLTIRNLTNQVLTIPANFSVAANRRGNGGNLIPYITTLDGTDVLSLSDHQLVDVFRTSPDTYMSIPANEGVEHEIAFNFPQDLVISETAEGYQLATPTSGKYFVRLVYSESEQSSDIWSGAIGSNQLEICLLN